MKNPEGKDKVSLSEKQIAEMRKLFFRRVTDSPQRAKIMRLSQILTDEFNTPDFWAMVYYYSLKENWPTLEEDFQRYGSVWEADTEISATIPERGRNSDRSRKRGD